MMPRGRNQSAAFGEATGRFRSAAKVTKFGGERTFPRERLAYYTKPRRGALQRG
jgi:hypothetical protein